jgi:hypothetical protein
MDPATELEQIAKQYRDEGFAVVIRPNADQLPAFADGFGVDLLAIRGPEKVLVQVKKNRAELEEDPDLPRQAEVVNSQPGWRYDLVLLEPDNPDRRVLRGAAEPTDEQLHRMLERAEESRKVGVREAAILLLWGPLEAAMRRHTGRDGGGRPEIQPRALLNQLYSSGKLTREEFDRLGLAWKIRTEIIHGYVAPPVDEAVIETMIDVTKRLLAESQEDRATAI